MMSIAAALQHINVFDILAVFATGFLLVGLFSKRCKAAPLPPGPKGHPVIRNFFDLPSKFEWVTFQAWRDVYEDICSLSILGNTIIIINSSKKAIEMLDKKGAIYSERPKIEMLSEGMGWNRMLVFNTGSPWRKGRKLFYQELGTPPSLEKFKGMQTREARRFLNRLLQSPEMLEEHIEQYVAGVVLGSAYGYEVKENDALVALVTQAGQAGATASTPGAYWVNYIPILWYIPSWFPGAGFQKVAAHGKFLTDQTLNQPFNFVKRQMATGMAAESFTSKLLAEGAPDEDVKRTAGAFFIAGSETSTAALHSFFLSMILYPDIQMRAREEIDNVVGKDRLPSFSDKDRLPYLNALIKEVLRFYPVLPIGLPHMTLENDIHDGYLIPKGSVVIANVWTMLRDPEVYKDPLKFDPSRFLSGEGIEPEQDPRDLVFGFGRRICPGALFAEASMYLLCSQTLATMDISAPVENGEKILPSGEFIPAMALHPVPFKCVIRSRSPEAMSLMQE